MGAIFYTRMRKIMLENFSSTLHEITTETSRFVIKSIPFLTGLAFVSALKVHLNPKKMSWWEAGINFILSYLCGAGIYWSTGNAYGGILAALVGEQIIKYMLLKFNDKNRDNTIENIAKKLNDKL